MNHLIYSQLKNIKKHNFINLSINGTCNEDAFYKIRTESCNEDFELLEMGGTFFNIHNTNIYPIYTFPLTYFDFEIDED